MTLHHDAAGERPRYGIAFCGQSAAVVRERVEG